MGYGQRRTGRTEGSIGGLIMQWYGCIALLQSSLPIPPISWKMKKQRYMYSETGGKRMGALNKSRCWKLKVKRCANNLIISFPKNLAIAFPLNIFWDLKMDRGLLGGWTEGRFLGYDCICCNNNPNSDPPYNKSRWIETAHNIKWLWCQETVS